MKKQTLITHIAVIAVAAAFIAMALGVEPLSKITIESDAAYPLLVAGLSLVFGIWIMLDDRRRQREEKEAVKIFDRDVLVLVALVVVYGILMYAAGYIVSTLVFSCAAIWYLHSHSWKMALIIGFIATFITVLVFKYGFSVILP